MKYELINASEEDIPKLMEYKLKSILDFASSLNNEEEERIKNYVKKEVPLQVKDYKMIFIDNKKVGCLLVGKEKDGVLLDEIYLEEDYRFKGLGTDILNSLIKDNPIIYLWVYKLNKVAISVYSKLGFKIIEETETRYYMKREYQ